MISLLLHMLLTPYALYGVLALAVIAAGIYFTAGPAALLKIATDIRTWFAIAAVLAVLAFAHQEQANADLKQQIATAAQQTTATTDGAKTTQLRVDQQTKRASQSQRIHQVIAQAPPEQAEDAVLDQIARERGQRLANAPSQIETKHDPDPASPPVAQRAPDRAAAGASGRLRKQPDVVVVP